MHVILTKLLDGKRFDEHVEPPRCEVVAIHQVECSPDDLGAETANRHGIPTYHSVAAALCRGGDELAVDGVVLVGEHGTYPFNDRGQKLYPRRELFDQVLGVFRQAGRVVPVYIDKHFSWNWTWAKYMWRSSQELGIPMMAGSSKPHALYEPEIPLPHGRRLERVVAFGYGHIEAHGFHALETALWVAAVRQGGEVGVRSVQCLSGADVWDAPDDGRWPNDVAEAAFAAVHSPTGRPRDHLAPTSAESYMGWNAVHSAPDGAVHAFEIEHRDGLRTTVFMLNGYCRESGFAYRIQGSDTPIATAAPTDPDLRPSSHDASVEPDELPRLFAFSGLVRAMEDFFITGEPVSPPERTYLATGLIHYVVESFVRGGARIATDDLDIAYVPSGSPDALEASRVGSRSSTS